MTLPASAPAPAPKREARILVVDDEIELCQLLAEYFTRHGLNVRTATDAATARLLIEQTPPDVAVLDVNMPGENGLSLARWLRDLQPDTGILMLTTISETIDRVIGLEMGADDYVAKPFELRELLARVRGLARRAVPRLTEPVEDDERIAFGNCWICVPQRKLLDQQGADIEVTASEFDLLALFARNPNRPLSRDQIMAQAHHRGWEVYDRSIDLRIMRLRRKIELNPNRPSAIKTVRGIGYMFVPAE